MSDQSTASEPANGGATKQGLPPGVRWPAWIQTLLVLFFAEWFVRYCARRFGPIYTTRVTGLGKTVSVRDTELTRQVFVDKGGAFRAGEANARFFGALGPNSILVLDGEAHLRQRRLMLPPLHGEAVKRYTEVASEIAAAEVERWPVGKPFAILPRMRAITLEVMLRAVVGVRDKQRGDRLRELLPGTLNVNVVLLAMQARYPGFSKSSLWRRLPLIRATEEVERLIYEEIAAHRADPEGREDILAMLLEARNEDGTPPDDQQLRDQLLTLLVAGSETGSGALAWCFERLLRHPAALERLRQEIASGEDDSYMEAVINETLRLRPLADPIQRITAAPVELGGYELPAGTIVAVSVWDAHHAEAYTDPDEFRPERMLEGPPAPYTLIPFGGGEHRCIGASFAVMEMKIVLRTVLEHAELRAAAGKDERPTRARSVIFIPAKGGRVILTAKTTPAKAAEWHRPTAPAPAS
jgi:cytochrome P450 family 135